jgi:hypothetical protein
MAKQNAVSYPKFRLTDTNLISGQPTLTNPDKTSDIFQQGHSFCPCCSDILLRHINRSGVYQLCRRCRQEMPDLGAIQVQHCYD